MRTFAAVAFTLALAAFGASAASGARQASTRQQSSAASQPPPAFDQWADDFGGAALDEAKWERFSFEGAGGGKLELKDGELRIRSTNGSRSGIRSKQSFASDKFSVEAQVARVGQQILLPGDKSSPLGFASLTLLFDGSGRNRVEWILTSEGAFEAWSVIDGRGERLDDRKLGTKIKNPILGIVRRGDEFLFVLNAPDSPPEAAQVGLKKTIKNLPRAFHVMLYGFGSSENDWNDVRVVTLK